MLVIKDRGKEEGLGEKRGEKKEREREKREMVDMSCFEEECYS